jgi:hypothetical protein
VREMSGYAASVIIVSSYRVIIWTGRQAEHREMLYIKYTPVLTSRSVTQPVVHNNKYKFLVLE